MTYEQRVEAFGDVCLKFTSLLESDLAKQEEVVATVLAMELPKSEEPVVYYLQQIYARYKPTKKNWFFKKSKSKKRDPFSSKLVKSRRTNRWIFDLRQLKVEERAVLFASYYLQLMDGSISELMQTPIEVVRKLRVRSAVKLERITEKYDLHYINETNFKKYFDIDFGSTYNAKRRLKQIQVVIEMNKTKQTKRKQPVSNWVPIVLACLIFFSTLATPFAYHESKKVPFLDEKMILPAKMITSLNQPNHQYLGGIATSSINYLIYEASMYYYISQQQLDMSGYEEQLANFQEQYGYNVFAAYEHDEDVIQSISKRLEVDIDEYRLRDLEMQVLFTVAYDQFTVTQQNELHNYYELFVEKYKEQIDDLYERYSNNDITEFQEDCKIVTYQFHREANEGEDEYNFSDYVPLESQFCILPNGDVSYIFLDNFYFYFYPLLDNIEAELEMSYMPFNYHLFYDHLANKSDLTRIEKELMQMTQILAYGYEQIFPGWIEQVPPLKSEDLIFSK